MDDRTPNPQDPGLQALIDQTVDEHIEQRLHQIEDRIYVLEHPPAQLEPPTCAAARLASIDTTPAPSIEPPHPLPNVTQLPSPTPSLLPILGRAVLGLAGAYLLRALEESNLAPPGLIVALAIAYAATWLALSARVPSGKSIAAVIYATTSCVILAPMLLELTLRFNLLPPIAAATILTAFALAALLLATTMSRASVFWSPWATCIALALLLMVATHHVATFSLALLILAAAAQLVPLRARIPFARLIAAPALDMALLFLLFIYTGPANARADYPGLASPILLALTLLPFALYATATSVDTLLRRHSISVFEAAQTIITFLIAFAAFHLFLPESAGPITATACLILAAICYAALFTRFNNPAQLRNRRTYSVWSVTLLLTGSLLVLPDTWLAVALGLASVAAAFLSRTPSRASLRFHALLYLAAAAYVSGLHLFIAHTLTAESPLPASAALLTVAASSALTYRLTQTPPATRLLQQLPAMAAALLAGASIAALLVHLASRLLPTRQSGPTALAQTLITCTLTLALAYASARTHRRELLWIAYAQVIAIAAKLLLVDTRQDHFAFIAGSFILYAATLITLPRLTATPPQRG